MRLIDRDRMLLDIKSSCWPQSMEYSLALRIVERLLRAAPAVDAEVVVRCQDCLGYTPVDDNTGKCVFLIGEHQYVVPDGYCYLGERKEGADNG